MIYKETYLPVDPDFMEIVAEIIKTGRSGKVHFFNPQGELDDAEGFMKEISKKKEGEFLIIGSQNVRLDKIITILGRPGPSYETYDRYANACLTCEDLDQF